MQKTDTEIRVDGTRALIEALGEVDAERFIALLLREPFDYTKWQQTSFADGDVEEISAAAMKVRERGAEQ